MDHDSESLDILPSLSKCYLPDCPIDNAQESSRKSLQAPLSIVLLRISGLSLFGFGNVPANNGNQNVDGHENASCNRLDGFLEQKCDSQRIMPKKDVHIVFKY